MRMSPPDCRITPGTPSAAAVAILAITRSLMTSWPRDPASSTTAGPASFVTAGPASSATAPAPQQRTEIEVAVAMRSDRHAEATEQDGEHDATEAPEYAGEGEEESGDQSHDGVVHCVRPTSSAVSKSSMVMCTGTPTIGATAARTRSAVS